MTPFEGANQSQHLVGTGSSEQSDAALFVREELGKRGQRRDVALLVGRRKADDKTNRVVRAVAEIDRSGAGSPG